MRDRGLEYFSEDNSGKGVKFGGTEVVSRGVIEDEEGRGSRGIEFSAEITGFTRRGITVESGSRVELSDKSAVSHTR